jgi:protein-S-isoprenylcysteine O-methyltransferase Ste14
MGLFLIPLLLGFALAGASAFTAAYSRWWGERSGQIASSILRNLLGIPLWMLGLLLAWLQPARFLFLPGTVVKVLGWLLIIAGSVLAIWGHVALGWRTHFPSIRDSLVRDGLYGRLRHPIYAGGMLIFVGLALLKPTSALLLACTLGFVWLIVQARLEEIDLVQRLPGYRAYMKEVPRLVPRLRKSGGEQKHER